MLKLRICPRCGTEIESETAFFCYNCGAELGGTKTSGSWPSSKEGERKIKESKPERRELKFTIRTASLLLSAFLVIFGILLTYFSKIKTAPLPPEPEVKATPNRVVVEEQRFPIPSFTFGELNFAEIVPPEVDLFLESKKPSVLLGKILSEEEAKRFEELSGLSLPEAESYLEEGYALVQEATSSAFLGIAKEEEFVRQKVQEVQEVQGFRPYLLGKYLIITNSSTLFEKIKEAQEKLRLNLSLSSAFAEAKRKLPPGGQIFVFGKVRPWFIPKGLEGDAFVVKEKNGNTLIVGME